jgi:hypothetical protein
MHLLNLTVSGNRRDAPYEEKREKKGTDVLLKEGAAPTG